ncbi:MAG: 4Fe-4S ferredoxin, partial [Acidimicrobiia bacterium]|nr:4Fe-4S ferredoxin [Acidimicrobiia bacterium]
MTVTPIALQPRPPSRRDPEGITEDGPGRLALQPGEQYRFTFDMGACIGCHSCEVA